MQQPPTADLLLVLLAVARCIDTRPRDSTRLEGNKPFQFFLSSVSIRIRETKKNHLPTDWRCSNYNKISFEINGICTIPLVFRRGGKKDGSDGRVHHVRCISFSQGAPAIIVTRGNRTEGNKFLSPLLPTSLAPRPLPPVGEVAREIAGRERGARGHLRGELENLILVACTWDCRNPPHLLRDATKRCWAVYFAH